MFDKWLNLPAHLYLRITALTILTVGIALSNVLMSIGTIWIISNWLIEADFKNYVQRFKEKKSVWFVIFIFFFLALSLIWSVDFNYGFKDLRIKLPFIVIPIVLATSEPLQRKHFYFLLYVFLGIVLYTSSYNIIRYNYFLPDSADIREMSTFISHVRFSLLINLAFFTTVFLVLKKKRYWYLWVPAGAWFLFYLFKSQIINGYILFVVLIVLTALYVIFRIQSTKQKYGLLSLFFFISCIVVFAGVKIVNQLKTIDPIHFEELDVYTANNNPYFHDTSNTEIENGNYVWIYVNQAEMEKEWEMRSAIPYDSLDYLGQPMLGTLMRFLTSKGYRKDSLGVSMLTTAEIEQIENGQTSIAVNKGFMTRLNTFFYELNIYQKGGDPNGHSLIQRIEHFKAASNIVRKFPWFGVGVGDVPAAFKMEYQAMNSHLIEANQHRSHNQFLTIWVGLGVLGFIAFVGLLIWPFFEVKHHDFFTLLVLVSLLVSCLFQDVIETQAGVTIFALFYSLAIYRPQELAQE